MHNPVEKDVREFYDSFGWVAKDGTVGETRYRRFSPPYYPYHEGVNDRTMSCFAGLGGSLLLAGGGDLPETHTAIAAQFSKVTCLDISKRALEIAETKLGAGAAYINASILDIPLPDDQFDAVYCAHVIYHIDIDLQQRAIEELIRVTRPGGRVVVIYGNPHSLVDRLITYKSKTPLLWKLRRPAPTAQGGPSLYFALHPLEWWDGFKSQCRVSFVPWDVMSCDQERSLLWSDSVAKGFYGVCGWLEKKRENLAVKWWQYEVVVLDKHREPTRDPSRLVGS
jgi:SAM-dependent methyltransferase